jgi:hypothetical protein
MQCGSLSTSARRRKGRDVTFFCDYGRISNMNNHAFLKTKVLSNQSAPQVWQFLCVFAAAFVMIAGILRLPQMELTETQVYFGSMGIMAFAGIFLILAALFRLSHDQHHNKP